MAKLRKLSCELKVRLMTKTDADTLKMYLMDASWKSTLPPAYVEHMLLLMQPTVPCPLYIVSNLARYIPSQRKGYINCDKLYVTGSSRRGSAH